ncbi:MAG: hypothetical protein J6Z79_02970 [Clostridia bacterium]|nr:hypothetical protein [Clostridia bacterium]
MADKKTKNPIQWVKHLVKDPVNTAEEANARKKEIMPVLLGAGIAFIVFIVLGILFEAAQGVLQVLAFVALLILAGCAFLLLIIKKMKQKFADLECPSCHAKIEYSDDVKVVDEKRVLDIKTTTSPNRTAGIDLKVTGTEHTTVTIHCKCQKCGAEKEFTTKFITIKCDRSENCSSLELGARRNQFENDIREEQKSGFDGSRGYRVTLRKDINELVRGYFGNVIQI